MPYSANAVNLDGTTYVSAQALTGVASGKVGLVSMWVKFHTGTDGNYHIFLFQNDFDFYIQRDGTNKIAVVGRNAAHSQILDIVSQAVCIESLGWFNILFAWDLNTGVGQCYINDASSLDGIPTTTNDTIGYAHGTSNYALFARYDGATIVNADVADVYINLAETLDLSNSTNRRKFIDAVGQPVDLGSNGSTPTGTSPIIFLSGATASWITNDGTGGGFTLSAGSIATASSSPSSAVSSIVQRRRRRR